MTNTVTVARALLEIGAVQFVPNAPVTFKSGIVSPVYVDNRRLIFHPAAWHTVIEGFTMLLEEEGTIFDVIAGIETAGIPHSAALAYSLAMPSVFVRKAAKDHGLKSRIEGGDVRGQTIILIEDMVTTGGSLISGVIALRDAGAVVDDCLAIISYGFTEAKHAFTEANVRLHTLITFADILAQARLSTVERDSVEDWLADPHGWAERQGQ